MKLSDLSDDVIDCILTSISDFTSLSAALLASKQPFYNVYRTRPNSILQKVACNVAGPAYQSAFKLLWHSHGYVFDILQDEQFYAKLPVPFNYSHAHKLTTNASVIQQLEDLFSVKYVECRAAFDYHVEQRTGTKTGDQPPVGSPILRP